MSTHAEFHLRHVAVEELRRLVSHPLGEVRRLAHEAREGATAASLGIVVAAVFLGVWSFAALVYLFVMLVARLFD